MKNEGRLKQLQDKLQSIVSLNERGDLNSLLTIMIVIVIVIAVFLALWNPAAAGLSLRGSLFNLINDTNFVATYGVGIRDALVFLLDLVPLGMFLAGVSVIGTLVVSEVKAGKIKIGA